MSGTEFHVALGRLLAEPRLLSLFRRDRPAALRLLGVDPAEDGDWQQIDMDQLSTQAETLLRKRWYEVKQLLPLTVSAIGESAHDHFIHYAANCWPTGHTRHWDDARQFCRFLMTERLPVRRDELNRIQFRLNKRRLALHVVHCRPLSRLLLPELQVLYRRKGRCRETRFYIARR